MLLKPNQSQGFCLDNNLNCTVYFHLLQIHTADYFIVNIDIYVITGLLTHCC